MDWFLYNGPHHESVKEREYINCQRSTEKNSAVYSFLLALQATVLTRIYIVTEAVVRKCSVKNMFLEISQNSQKNTCAKVSFLIKLQPQTCNFIKKEALAELFSCEFCEISMNTFSYRTPPVVVSEVSNVKIKFMF